MDEFHLWSLVLKACLTLNAFAMLTMLSNVYSIPVSITSKRKKKSDRNQCSFNLLTRTTKKLLFSNIHLFADSIQMPFVYSLSEFCFWKQLEESFGFFCSWPICLMLFWWVGNVLPSKSEFRVVNFVNYFFEEKRDTILKKWEFILIEYNPRNAELLTRITSNFYAYSRNQFLTFNKFSKQ